MPSHNKTLYAVIPYLVLAAAILATFGRAVRHEYLEWDDQLQVFRNPDFNPPTVEKVMRYWRDAHMSIYMPVTYSLWGAIAGVAYDEPREGETSGLNPAPFHAFNVLLQVLCACVLFRFLQEFVEDRPAALLGALVFGLHPLMVEPVAWISGMYTVLSTLLSLVALLLYMRYARRDRDGRRDARTWSLLGLATLMYLLAMLSKPSAVVVPAIVVAIELLFLRRHWRRWAAPVGAWFALAIPIMLKARSLQASGPLAETPLLHRPLIVLDSLGFYLQKVVAPLSLGIDYGRAPDRLIDSGQLAYTWILPALVIVVAILLVRRTPWLLLSLLIFTIAAMPYLGLVRFEFQWFSTVADRYVHFAMVGVAIATAFLLRGRKRAILAVAAVVVLALGLRSGAQIPHWQTSDTLFHHAIRVNPDSLVAHNALAFLASQRGEIDEAMRGYDRVLRIRGNDPVAHYNVANRLLAMNRLEEAIGHYRASLEAFDGNARVHNNLAVALYRAGRPEESLAHFAQAVRINPRYVEARVAFAGVLASGGLLDQAMAQYQAALEVDPTSETAQRGLRKVHELRRAGDPGGQ